MSHLPVGRQGYRICPNYSSSRPERSGVEGPLFLHLAAISGKKVSPLRAARSGRDDGKRHMRFASPRRWRKSSSSQSLGCGTMRR
jgi:hypothetical protein